MNLLVLDHATSYSAVLAPCRFVSLAPVTCRRRSIGLAVWLALLLVVGDSLSLWGQQPEIIDREPEIKAAYLYNFGRYVEWPPAAIGPREFVVGVVGDSPIIAPLATIAGTKKVNNRSITLRRFRTEKDFQQCHLLFVPAGQDPKLVAAIVKAAGNTATLIVGEEQDFAVKQGHVGFYTAQNNVKFEINHKAAENAGLKISSKLLSLGRIVGGKPGK